MENVRGSLPRLSPDLASALPGAAIADEVAEDLEASFGRVRDNMPAFVPILDEIFEWHHRVRLLMANQMHLLGFAFRPVCPGLSMRFLRMMSTVHPKLRVRRRLMDGVARLPEFDALAGIPSAQIPWIGGRAPAPLRELTWGMRSGLDQILIRSVLRSKDPRRRQRVLRSLDLIKEYRREHVDATVRAWFSEKWVKAEAYVQAARSRAELSAWPLINVDISAPANVSVTLDLAARAEGHAALGGQGGGIVKEAIR